MTLTEEILELSQKLVRIPSVTVGAEERLPEVNRAFRACVEYLADAGLQVRCFENGKYPGLLAGFPGEMHASVMLSGHFDVVAPEPDDSQFDCYIEGDYLWGRATADMKVVVATYMVWMKDVLQHGAPYPRINLMLIGNEENGETEPMGTAHILAELEKEGYAPEIFIAGERTEEKGSGLWGAICDQNRGVGRFKVVARGVRAHSGMAPHAIDLVQSLVDARAKLNLLAGQYLTLKAEDGWQSQIKFPFLTVGESDIYNITPAYGELGVEIRAIPQDDLFQFYEDFAAYCEAHSLEIQDLMLESGSACSVDNPWLQKLVEAVREESGQEPVIGKKMAGTSARFAPGNQGVVWGQSGIGPHSAGERHYIPSIEPYYRALDNFGRRTIGTPD